MRKTVILLIIVIYLASILIVGITGINVKVPVVTRVETIDYVPVGEKSSSDEDKIVYKSTNSSGSTLTENVYYQKNATGSDIHLMMDLRGTGRKYYTFSVSFDAKPINADDKYLEFVYSSDCNMRNTETNEAVTDPEQTGENIKGFVIFKRQGDTSAEITIVGLNALRITVRVLNKGNGAEVSKVVSLLLLTD